ncbi:MAG: hypothetical protein LBL86_08025 [Coriobacteriales bacterium]|nr:hypothetical protein [Coriobacteriales bacterium]
MKTVRIALLTLTALCAYGFYFCIGWYYFSGSHQEYAQSADSLNLVTSLIGYLMLASAVLALFNCVTAIMYGRARRKQSEPEGAGRAPFVFKVIMIPYFLLSILCIGLVALSGYLASFIALFFPKLPIISGIVAGVAVSVFLFLLLAVCYLQIVATSVHSTSDILLTCRRLNIHRGLRALYIVLQFIPIADVISLPIITRYLNDKSLLALQTGFSSESDSGGI